jgi:hypothetical protein
LVQVVEADPLAAKRAERARKARLSYAENKEAERKRRQVGMARTRANGGPQKSVYDVDDYVQEWEELTWLGRDSASIIDGSIPSDKWFVQWVLPRVSVALCPHCRTYFNPMLAGMLRECSNTCHLAKDNEWGRRGA